VRKLILGLSFFRERLLVALAAMLEAVTGLVLIIAPSFAVRLLLGEEPSGAGVALGRVAGFGLFSLGVACWPRLAIVGSNRPALRALLTYNLLITCYLLYLGISSERVGILLWPAVVLHAVLTLFLARASWTGWS
jgi:hypothetical protein